MPQHKVLEYRNITVENLALMTDEEFIKGNRALIDTINEHMDAIVTNKWLSKEAFDEYIVAFRKAEAAIGNDTNPHLPLMFAEIELRHHKGDNRLPESAQVYIQKAHSFVCEVRQHISSNGMLATKQAANVGVNAPPLKWTGNAVDLVEMVYGISVMGCVNEGKTPLRDMAAMLYKFFGISAKDCYRFYVDIRRRKNDDRTYFLDEMRKKLNEKMRADDEKESKRR